MPPPTRLRDLIPAPPPRALLRDLVATELAPALLWRADHIDAEQLVTGGTEQVHLLAHAIDGDRWPYTIVTTLDGGRWFQVIGAVDACVFEIGDHTDVCMVARRTATTGTQIELPAGCRYWVAAANPLSCSLRMLLRILECGICSGMNSRTGSNSVLSTTTAMAVPSPLLTFS